MARVFRCILPDWAKAANPLLPKVREGQFTPDELVDLNCHDYNIYYLPNSPTVYDPSRPVAGSDIDDFQVIFVDMDVKDGKWESIETFICSVQLLTVGFPPSEIVLSGHGVHVYWKVSDLDAKSYLRLTRRLMRYLDTDPAVGQIYQLMRLPGSVNTKDPSKYMLCETVQSLDVTYTCEELDSFLPALSPEDEAHCTQHYDKTNKVASDVVVDEKLPLKFAKLLASNAEVQKIWAGDVPDRSKADYRLGNLLFQAGFTLAEARSVLVNTQKAHSRTPQHRLSYAENIIDKVWTHAADISPDKGLLSMSVADILANTDTEDLKGIRFPCDGYFDLTTHGFRLGQVVGLCAGVGVGKTAVALNIFRGFVEANPDYIHIFVTLEQPAIEIADRWRKMCGDNVRLHSKVHVLSNYNDDGTYRNLSLDMIRDYILELQKDGKHNVGCVCIDHIGVLKQEDKSGEYQGLRDICSGLKAFTIATGTLLIIQSQTNRDKAGIGDLELFKDAAYGTQHFESFVDFLMTVWQPLKRCYKNAACPRVTAYKFAKIRFKSKTDKVVEDECCRLIFDQDTETLRELTTQEDSSFDFFAGQALTLRGKDRKTDLVPYTSVRKVTNAGNTDSKDGGDLGGVKDVPTR